MSTQSPFDQRNASGKNPHVEVFWHAVTYKTVALYIVLLAAIIFGAFYLVVPDWYSAAYKKFTKVVNDQVDEALVNDQKRAKFVNLDGKVQVKKVNSVQWVDADYKTTLDKGDLVQTGSEGVARITFGDGTTYTVKSDTLVTVEENSTDSSKPTSVSVRIQTGEVNLATPNWSAPNSKAGISVEDANAVLQPNSRAAVKNDPGKNEHEILVATGSADVQRGSEKVELTQYEKVSFANGGPILKSNVLAPPDLAEPLNLAPIIAEVPKNFPVHFEWKPVQDAVYYTLRISTTAMFTKTVKEARVTSPNSSTEVTGLDAGDYFWNVTATDAKKQTSEPSETFKFTVVAQGKSQEMVLELDQPLLHGRVVEIVGRTEPGAALIINGQPVPNISPDGTFRHFTEPLDPGQHTIVVIGQNRRGGTDKKQVSIVVPK